jgi:hypothetical protein
MKLKVIVLGLILTFLGSTKLHGYTVSSPFLNTTYESTTVVNLIYKNGTLNIKGLTGVGTIRIYSIIGNEIRTFNNVELSDFQQKIVLSPKTMFIIRIEKSLEVRTYKLVTR